MFHSLRRGQAMSITPIQTTSPDQVQAPQKVGGAGGHKGKAPQANQMAHATNAKDRYRILRVKLPAS